MQHRILQLWYADFSYSQYPTGDGRGKFADLCKLNCVTGLCSLKFVSLGKEKKIYLKEGNFWCALVLIVATENIHKNQQNWVLMENEYNFCWWLCFALQMPFNARAVLLKSLPCALTQHQEALGKRERHRPPCSHFSSVCLVGLCFTHTGLCTVWSFHIFPFRRKPFHYLLFNKSDLAHLTYTRSSGRLQSKETLSPRPLWRW